MSDFFTYNEPFERSDTSGDAQDELAGFHVEASDGSLGTVQTATYEAGKSYLVVDTGGTIFSKSVVIPAGAIERIDRDGKRVYVNLTQDQIKDAPAFDEASFAEEDYHRRLGEHYGR